MKKLLNKRTTAALLAVMVVAALSLTGFAMDIVDEADIYGEDVVDVAATTIEDSPAIKTAAGTETPVPIDSELDVMEEEEMVDDDLQDLETPNVTGGNTNYYSPSTGGSGISMTLPVGMALLALGTITALLRKRR